MQQSNHLSLRFFLSLLILAAASVEAADLSKVPRTILKEPAYQTKPRYMLVVFGPKAKFRVWLVFDGDIAYVDRNGNGDLTDAGERLAPAKKLLEKSLIHCNVYHVGPIKDRFTSKTYRKITVDRLALTPGYVPKNQKEKERIKFLRRNGTQARIRIWKNEEISQTGFLWGAGEAAKANILHFDGPLAFRLISESLQRGDEPADLRVELGTPGLGKASHYASFDIAPKNAHPLAQLEFPSKKPGRRTIKTNCRLKERC